MIWWMFLSFLWISLLFLRTRGSQPCSVKKQMEQFYRQELFEFIEEEAGIIHIKRYNLTASPVRIEELKPEKLETDPGCNGMFEKVESGVYVGTLSNCRLNRQGKSYPVYIGVCTCSAIIVYMPAHAAETSNALPCIFKKTASFPLPEYLFRDKYSDYTYNFVNPC